MGTAGKSNGFQMGVNGSSLTVHAHCKQLASVIAGTRLSLGQMGHDVRSIRGNACSDRLIGHAPLLLPCRCVCGGSQGRCAAAASKPAYLLSCPARFLSAVEQQAKTLLFLSCCFIAHFASSNLSCPNPQFICYQKKTHTALPLQIRHYCRQRLLFSALKRIAPLPHRISTG